MPELPEVETVVRGLRVALPGREIVGLRLGKTDFIDDPVALAESLPGKRIVGIERVGKFIDMVLHPVAELGNPPAPLHLIVHLGMTGRLVVRPANDPAAPHTHVVFELDDGRELRYVDSRRFGRMLVLPEAMVQAFHGGLGREPLEIPEEEFRQRLAGRRARIKALLLDQRLLRGIGNIYADESLWRARIHPARLAVRLQARQLKELWQAIRYVLRAAIRLHGSSISDFVDAEGNPGEYQQHHRVYGREGQACRRCKTSIRRVIVAGRSSYFCPRCQAPPRSRPKRPRKSQRTRGAGSP
jgi:formamidopyrimidine-DNA glycosylase